MIVANGWFRISVNRVWYVLAVEEVDTALCEYPAETGAELCVPLLLARKTYGSEIEVARGLKQLN